MNRVHCLAFCVVLLCACGASDDDSKNSYAVSDSDASAVPDVGDVSDSSDAKGVPVDVSDSSTPCLPGYAHAVHSVRYGEGAGFGQSDMPGVVLGAPQGDVNDTKGSLDVVSLGLGGEIVLSFGYQGIADLPGDDFIVFENAFYVGGQEPKATFAEPAQVSVSVDGTTWVDFPCDASVYPYAGCAGTLPTYSNPTNGISAFDAKSAGGNAFDLASIGVKQAVFVRLRDLSTKPTPKTSGFDLDAVSVIHPACNQE